MILKNSDYKRGKNGLLECPCCGNYTINDKWINGEQLEVITDDCAVCFWTFDLGGQERPDQSWGPNPVSLKQAKINYKNFGAFCEKMKPYVRSPFPEELPENN